jgi:hypothetical protein
MTPKHVLAAAIAATLAFAAAAPAQEGRLYRWTDKDGNVHYSQTIPAEAVEAARDEISMNTALTVDRVERALTPEEREAAEAAAAVAAEEAKLLQDAANRDRVLLTSYPNEEELRRAFGERVQLQRETVRTTQVAIESDRQSLAALLRHAADLELNDTSVDRRTAENIVQVHGELVRQMASLSTQQAESDALALEMEATVARYRELRALDGDPVESEAAPAADGEGKADAPEATPAGG